MTRKLLAVLVTVPLALTVTATAAHAGSTWDRTADKSTNWQKTPR